MRNTIRKRKSLIDPKRHYESRKSTQILKKPISLAQRLSNSFNVPINQISLTLYGSYAGIEVEQKRIKHAGYFVIHPFSIFRVTWDVFSLMLLMANVFVIPVGIAFCKGEEAGWLAFKVSLS